MIQLDLTPEEQKVLLDVLNADLSDLAMEISSSDHLDYRDMLKERREALNKVVRTLQ